MRVLIKYLEEVVVSPILKNFSDVFLKKRIPRLRKSREEVQVHERERTKRIVYSVIYGVGKERPMI